MKTPLPKLPRNAEDWSIWADHDIEFAEKTLLKYGEVGPLFILHRADGSVMTLKATFISPEQKQAALDFLRAVGIAEEVVGMAYIGEVWMIVRKVPSNHDWLDEVKKAPRPSEAHDRIEAVTVMITYRDGEKRSTIGRMGEIIRRDKKPVSLRSMAQAVDPELIGGDIPDLLMVPPPPPDMVARAKELMAKYGPDLMKALRITL